MPCYDFRCRTCDKLNESIYFSIKDLPRQIPCPCGGHMEQYYDGRRINPHLSSNYHNGMYGTYHHGFGCIVRNYAHKQELLKKYNVSEAADSVKGSKSWRDQVDLGRQKNKGLETNAFIIDDVDAFNKGHLTDEQQAKVQRTLNMA